MNGLLVEKQQAKKQQAEKCQIVKRQAEKC